MGKVKKRRDTTKRLSLILNVLLILALLASAFWVFSYKKSKDGEIDRLNKIIRATNENNIIIPINDFKEYVTRYGVLTRFAQRYFPDKLVYPGYHGIVFADIYQGIAENPLNKEECMVYEEGRAYYVDGDYQSQTGIDVSYSQGYIDWQKVVEDDIDFAIIRVGVRGYATGRLFVDEFFHYNIKEANAVKMPVGVYFFSGAINEKEAIEEADFVLKQIKGYNVELPIAFDMEDMNEPDSRMKELTTVEKTAIARAFCQRIQEAGYDTLVYGNAKWLLESLNYQEIAEYGVWYANWDFLHWPYELMMYQYSSSGKVNGIKGRVDMDIGFFNYYKEQ